MPCRVPRPDRTQRPLRPPRCFRFPAYAVISSAWFSRCITSAIFLVFYLVYHYLAGSTPFRGQGPTRWLYLTVLISHTFLATLGVVPLVFLTLLRALQRDFSRHRLIAATTFPIWVYVSVTGVLIYLMLYHLPVADFGSAPGAFASRL